MPVSKQSHEVPTVRALVIGQERVGKSEFIKALGEFQSFPLQDYDQCLYKAPVKALDKRLLPLVEDTLQNTTFSWSTMLSPKRGKPFVFNFELWEIPSSVIEVMHDPRFLLQHIKDAHICFCLVDSTNHVTSLRTMTAFRDAIEQYGGCRKLYSLIFHKFDIRKNLSRLTARRIFKENTEYFHHYNKTRKSRPSRIRKAVFKVVDHFLHAELRRLSSNQCLYPWPTMKDVIEPIEESSSTQSMSDDEENEGIRINIPPISSEPRPSEMQCSFVNDSIPFKIASVNRSLEKCSNTINNISQSQDSVMDNQLQILQKNLINVRNESASQLAEVQTQMSEMGEMNSAQEQEMRGRLDEIKSAVTKSRAECKRYSNAIQLFDVPGLQKQRDMASSTPSPVNSPANDQRHIRTPVHSSPEDSSPSQIESRWCLKSGAGCISIRRSM